MSGCILVVDDDPVFRGLAVRMLAAVGLVEIAEADTAAAALTTASAVKPHAALVDVGLPDRDGLSLARDLVALPWQPRVVLTSSDSEAASPSDVRRTGAHSFVPKDQLPDAALRDLLTGGPG